MFTSCQVALMCTSHGLPRFWQNLTDLLNLVTVLEKKQFLRGQDFFGRRQPEYIVYNICGRNVCIYVNKCWKFRPLFLSYYSWMPMGLSQCYVLVNRDYYWHLRILSVCYCRPSICKSLLYKDFFVRAAWKVNIRHLSSFLIKSREKTAVIHLTSIATHAVFFFHENRVFPHYDGYEHTFDNTSLTKFLYLMITVTK